jgi:CheY-like chemotaxis protein
MADTRGTILVVDDDPATVELLAGYLTGKQLAVACAHTLDEALAEVIRALNQVRILICFSQDLGDLEANTAACLEEHMLRARRSVGLS